MSKIRLLLVEDDEDFNAALTARLTKRHFEVIVATSAEEALDIVKDKEPAIIVADIKLPGMDGMEFLAEIRKFNKDLPVILITGYASLESAREAVKLNAADYLLKPLENIDELLNPINKATYSYRLLIENKVLTDNLKAKVEELNEKNVALREILAQLEIEKKRIEDDIYTNISQLLLPIIKKLRSKTTKLDAKYLDLLHLNVEKLTSSFGRMVTDRRFNLTPREVEICNMIRCNLSSKEISRLLNISIQTTERHRNNIRKKLGLVNKHINLSTYLKVT